MHDYRLIGAKEVASKLGVSKGTAYRIIRDLNADMEAEGKKTIPGKVDEGKFMLAYFADLPGRSASDER